MYSLRARCIGIGIICSLRAIARCIGADDIQRSTRNIPLYQCLRRRGETSCRAGCEKLKVIGSKMWRHSHAATGSVNEPGGHTVGSRQASSLKSKHKKSLFRTIRNPAGLDAYIPFFHSALVSST